MTKNVLFRDGAVESSCLPTVVEVFLDCQSIPTSAVPPVDGEKHEYPRLLRKVISLSKTMGLVFGDIEIFV